MAITSGAHKKALTGDQKPQKQVLVKIDRVSKKFDETLAVDDELYEVKAVARQYMTLHGSHVREESSAAVTVERVHKGYAMRGG